MVRLWGIFEGSFVERNYFAFSLLDQDSDGVIHAFDIQMMLTEFFGNVCPPKQKTMNLELSQQKSSKAGEIDLDRYKELM